MKLRVEFAAGRRRLLFLLAGKHLKNLISSTVFQAGHAQLLQNTSLLAGTSVQVSSSRAANSRRRIEKIDFFAPFSIRRAACVTMQPPLGFLEGFRSPANRVTAALGFPEAKPCVQPPTEPNVLQCPLQAVTPRQSPLFSLLAMPSLKRLIIQTSASLPHFDCTARRTAAALALAGGKTQREAAAEAEAHKRQLQALSPGAKRTNLTPKKGGKVHKVHT